MYVSTIATEVMYICNIALYWAASQIDDTVYSIVIQIPGALWQSHSRDLFLEIICRYLMRQILANLSKSIICSR